jgi:hypothetical protein
MPQKKSFKYQSGKVCREYVVTITDDAPERAEAVAFFGREMLIPDIHKLCDLVQFDELPLDDAQAYLDAHPIQVTFNRLTLDEWGPLFNDRKYHATLNDDDLARLKYIPELKDVQVFTSQISDKGIAHFQHLREIKRLWLYSSNVTDRCLAVIRDLVSLEGLDLQGARNVSKQAFADTVALLPNLVDSYAPSNISLEGAPEPPIQEYYELYDDWRQRIIFDPDP